MLCRAPLRRLLAAPPEAPGIADLVGLRVMVSSPGESYIIGMRRFGTGQTPSPPPPASPVLSQAATPPPPASPVLPQAATPPPPASPVLPQAATPPPPASPVLPQAATPPPPASPLVPAGRFAGGLAYLKNATISQLMEDWRKAESVGRILFYGASGVGVAVIGTCGAAVAWVDGRTEQRISDKLEKESQRMEKAIEERITKNIEEARLAKEVTEQEERAIKEAVEQEHKSAREAHEQKEKAERLENDLKEKSLRDDFQRTAICAHQDHVRRTDHGLSKVETRVNDLEAKLLRMESKFLKYQYRASLDVEGKCDLSKNENTGGDNINKGDGKGDFNNAIPVDGITASKVNGKRDPPKNENTGGDNVNKGDVAKGWRFWPLF